MAGCNGEEDQVISSFPLWRPDDLKEWAVTQAEAERSFAARTVRATPGRACEILARAGRDNPPQPGDELVAED